MVEYAIQVLLEKKESLVRHIKYCKRKSIPGVDTSHPNWKAYKKESIRVSNENINKIDAAIDLIKKQCQHSSGNSITS